MNSTQSKVSPKKQSAANISIVLPCYNARDTIEATLTSIFNQSEQNFEVILVDDCSTDDTLSVSSSLLKPFKHTIVKLEQNSGPGTARNEGMKYANGRYVAFIDADDVWTLDKLKTQLAFHQDNNYSISCTGFLFGGHKITEKKISYDSLLRNNVVNTSTVMFDRNRINITFSSMETCEDYREWLAIIKKTDIGFVPEILAVRKKFDGISKNKLAMAKMRWRVYRADEGIGFFRSVYLMANYVFYGVIKYALVSF